MAPSSRTLKLICAAIRVLYRVRDSNLSGLQSNSIPNRHILQPTEVRAVKNVSESIIEHESHEKDRDTNDKTKKWVS